MKRRKDSIIAWIKKLKLGFIIFIVHFVTLNMPQFITVPYIMSTGKLEIMSIHFYIKEHVCAKSCLTLCDPKDCSPPGFSFMEFSRQEC